MRVQKDSLDKLAAVVTLGVLGLAGVSNGYRAVRYRLKGARDEEITVAKIYAEKSNRGPKLKVSGSSLIKTELLNIPLGGNSEQYIVENDQGECYLIGQGNLHLRQTMKIGETYRCKVIGDRDWGLPRIVSCYGKIVESDEVNLDESIDE